MGLIFMYFLFFYFLNVGRGILGILGGREERGGDHMRRAPTRTLKVSRLAQQTSRQRREGEFPVVSPGGWASEGFWKQPCSYFVYIKAKEIITALHQC